jgi:3-phytase
MKYLFLNLLLLLLLASCSKQQNADSNQKPVIINEIYQTERDEPANIDSPSFWKGPNDQIWIISTAKEADALYIDNAVDGSRIQVFGHSGENPGQFKRPNGIFIIDDLVFVVERDNRRVQVLSLPDFETKAFLSDSLLRKPYGLFVQKKSLGSYCIFVTDNYEAIDEQIPRLELLDKRVHVYNLQFENGKARYSLEKMFGDTTNAGALRVVESIWADLPNNQLLIAEEDKNIPLVKVYDLEGNYTGKNFGKGIFKSQVEGMAIYDDGKNDGFWIITDQSQSNNHFHLFKRKTLEHIGFFKGPKTTNTDGIWLTQEVFGAFPKGVFFAVHNDGNVSAFDIEKILRILE